MVNKNHYYKVPMYKYVICPKLIFNSKYHRKEEDGKRQYYFRFRTTDVFRQPRQKK